MPIFSTNSETRRLRDAQASHSWQLADVATISGVDVITCGDFKVDFFNDDLSRTSINTSVFTDTRDIATGNNSFDLNYIEDTTLAQSYQIKYEVSLLYYPSVTVMSLNTYSLVIEDPCQPPILAITAPTLSP